jgi:hypothetical protein
MLVGSTSSFPTADVWRDALLAIFRTITNGMWDVGDCWNAAAPMESQSSCICLLRIAGCAVNDFSPLYPPGPQQDGGGELGSNYGRPTLVRATAAASSKNISAILASNGF